MTPAVKKAIELDQRIRRGGMGLPKALPKDPAKRAEALDHRIRDNFLGFVQLGQDLMVMRDERLYKHLDYIKDRYGSATWENYVKDVQDLSESRTAEVIRASIVYRAIESSANGGGLPNNERQCRILATKINPSLMAPGQKIEVSKVVDGEVITEERSVPLFERVALEGSTDEKVPVAIHEAGKPFLLDAWAKVVKDYEAEVANHNKDIKAKLAEARKLKKEGKEDEAEAKKKEAETKRKRGPRKMSAKFVEDHLPTEYTRHERGEGSKGTKEYDIWGRASLRFIESTKRLQRSKTKMQQLANKEEWHDYTVEAMMDRAEQIKESCELLINTLDGLAVYDASDTDD